jgi:fatty-acyl-CoA synthase
MPLSYVSGPSEEPLLGETIGENFDRIAGAFADEWCLISRHEGVRLTYAGMAAAVDRCGRGLLARGIRVGDRVGIWAPNRYEWVVTQFATARAGAILVTINPAYQQAELHYALEKAGVKLLLMAGYDVTLPPGLDPVVFDRDWDAFLRDGERVSQWELAAREPTLDPDDPINIQFTSGTTGAPKGATLTHRNILNNAYFTAVSLRYTSADRVCVPVPLYHCFGMVLGSLACATHGACLVLPSEGFNPAAVLTAVERERCTSLYGVPTMFIAELPLIESYDLSSLRTGAMGGAPCPVDVMNRVRSQMGMTEVAILCGMTETSPVSTMTAHDDPLDRRVETVGRPHAHVEVKIVDPETGETVPPGVPGEQCTRGYSVMQGYWEDPEATARAIDVDGWMHTGDLAVMDADGYVSIVGRIKDMIIRGGENIYPREIEEFLIGLPEVADAHVIGVPSARYGEEVMAWVKPAAGAQLSGTALAQACAGRIARFKIPAYWRVVEEFPMTVTGKVQKFVLRQMAA